jgi:uncharacterized protein
MEIPVIMRSKKLVIALALAATSWAQVTSRPASITAVGNATVSVPPDLARVDVGVVTQSATAQDATAGNATRAAAVIAALQGLVSSNSNIKTVSYSLSPVYNNPPAGQSPAIIGYMVTNTVEVTLFDLTQIGKVLDAAIQSGANRVQGITFDLQDRNPVVAQALKTAASTARAQADAIATGLKVQTGAVLHASEGVNVSSPLLGAVSPAATSTPVETGVVVVHASVTLEVAIAP